MSSKTDPRYGGKRAPLKKTKVKGGYQQRYRKLRREKKASRNKASKSYLQRINRRPQ